MINNKSIRKKNNKSRKINTKSRKKNTKSRKINTKSRKKNTKSRKINNKSRKKNTKRRRLKRGGAINSEDEELWILIDEQKIAIPLIDYLGYDNYKVEKWYKNPYIPGSNIKVMYTTKTELETQKYTVKEHVKPLVFTKRIEKIREELDKVLTELKHPRVKSQQVRFTELKKKHTLIDNIFREFFVYQKLSTVAPVGDDELTGVFKEHAKRLIEKAKVEAEAEDKAETNYAAKTEAIFNEAEEEFEQDLIFTPRKEAALHLFFTPEGKNFRKLKSLTDEHVENIKKALINSELPKDQFHKVFQLGHDSLEKIYTNPTTKWVFTPSVRKEGDTEYKEYVVHPVQG
jgi:ribosomal silencing factor RsfS